MAVVSINSNVASSKAQRGLARATELVSSTSEKLSSGQRINRASDDAAGLAIASQLEANSRVYSRGILNINDAVSALSIAEGAYSSLSEITQRVSELAEQAANGTYSSEQRRALHSEASALSDEFDRIAATASFNGIKLLDGSFNNRSIQVGYGTDESLSITLSAIGTRIVGDGTFQAGTSYAVTAAANTLYNLAEGDLNGDGNRDLVTGTIGTGVNISLGNGDGTFKAVTTVGGLNGPVDVILHDFNGDNELDIFTGNVGALSAGVALGNGDGTFLAPTYFDGGSLQPFALAMADFNEDGRQDAVLTGYGQSAIGVMFGNANGSFSATQSIATLANPNSVHTSDFDRDGNQDIVVAQRASGTVAVLFGNGNGTFDASVSYATGSLPYNIQSADLNQDGYADLIVGGEGNDYIDILFGNSDGTFKARISYQAGSVGSQTRELSVVDLNGDSNFDIVATAFVDNAVSIFIGNGDGTFNSRVTYGTGGTPYGLVTTDLNNDGAIDLATSDFSSGTLSVLLANTQNTSTSLGNFSLLTQSDALTALDNFAEVRSDISTQLGNVGSYQSRLFSAAANLRVLVENSKNAKSRIVDADVAQESATYLQAQIIQQTASAILAQANTAPSLALSLLRG